MQGKEILETTSDTRKKEINIPDWGGHFVVHEMPGEGREEFEQAAQGRGDFKNKVRALTVAWCLRNTDGSMVFDPRDAEQIHAIARKPYRILHQISELAVELSQTTIEALEDAEKN